jgi:DNA invertase Pin-like site-specific DNA recombinase
MVYEKMSKEELIAELQRRDSADYWAYQEGLGKNERGAGRKPKLTPEIIKTVRAYRLEGLTYQQIATETGLSYGTVHKAAN